MKFTDIRSPMLASLQEPPVQQKGLVYEPKYDGIRAIVEIRNEPGRRFREKTTPGLVSIFSRNGHDKTRQFPAIAKALASLGKRLKGPVVLDGEIVAVDRNARPLGFQHIQGRIHLTADPDIARAEGDQPAVLVVFDLLRDGDEDLRKVALAARRLRLQDRIKPKGAERDVIWLSEIALDDGRPMLQRARAEGWEGLIVKQAQSLYASGKRSPSWRKLKLLKQQEFVVGGWTEPRQSRQHFGSLLVGYYDDGGALKWAGSVGTGFDEKELIRVAALLKARETAASPFDDKFKTGEPAHWVKPTLVVEIRFTEWTSDGLLRQPVYLGTREDKSARAVRREDGKPVAKPVVASRVSWQKHHRVRDGSSPGNDSRAQYSAGNDARPHYDLVERLNELEDARKDGDLDLPNGDRLRVTNLAKVFWADLGITKGELLRYYVQVAPLILPAVDDRPLVMKRFPNGVTKQAFYQQRHPEQSPPGVRREVLPENIEPIDEEGPRDRLIGGSITTLLYMTQLAAISQDPWFSRVADPLHADYVAIDLDPGEGAGFSQVLDVARWVKEELDRLGVPGVPKTSGSRGIHIYIPLPPKTTYDTGQLLCHLVAAMVTEKHPKVATIERMVKKRPKGTVYVDYLQNILGKTLATAYSARASDYAGVSTPLDWREVKPGLDPRDFTIRTVLKRFASGDDKWAPLRTQKPVNLQAVLRRAGKAVKS
ncbi:MAG TPA: DNA ligase D [Vicinamibacterales bacterium]|nr:DNA ligase D [Vicinamibacterales bacterium]